MRPCAASRTRVGVSYAGVRGGTMDRYDLLVIGGGAAGINALKQGLELRARGAPRAPGPAAGGGRAARSLPAAGRGPVPPPLPGRELAITSDQILFLERFPEHLIL